MSLPEQKEREKRLPLRLLLLILLAGGLVGWAVIVVLGYYLLRVYVT